MSIYQNTLYLGMISPDIIRIPGEREEPMGYTDVQSLSPFPTFIYFKKYIYIFLFLINFIFNSTSVNHG